MKWSFEWNRAQTVERVALEKPLQVYRTTVPVHVVHPFEVTKNCLGDVIFRLITVSYETVFRIEL